MEILEGQIRDYDWGSTTAIPELLGRPATGAPAAELWLGAHAGAPARVGARHTPLDEVIAADPIGALGGAVDDRFGSLPFLLKVLAAEAPLSLQAHPSAAQAEAGYQREEAAGVPLDALNRSFRDRSHKPELICALTEFDALCGFRDPAATLALFATIDAPALGDVSAPLRDDPSPAGLGRLLEHLLRLEPVEAAALVETVVDACRAPNDRPYGAERAMAVTLAARYPGDAGVVTALLLNLVRLQPNEALFLGAGNLHAYLRGTGIEIMASSDNVLRGGLTTKYVDLETLLQVVDPTPMRPQIQHPTAIEGIARYAAPVPDFRLARVELDGARVLDVGPLIVLCTAGTAEIAGRVLDRGSAAWIPASDGRLTVDGRATLFVAGVGEIG